MAAAAGPQTPFQALRDGSIGSYWSPRRLSSLWQDIEGTIPAVVGSEVKRMDDLGGLGNHMLYRAGTRYSAPIDHTYTFKGPILRKERTQLYLDFDGNGAGLAAYNLNGAWPDMTTEDTIGCTISVAYLIDSEQPIMGSLHGTVLAHDALGNYGTVWRFGGRWAQGIKFYCTGRNADNTAWLAQFSEGGRFGTLTSPDMLDSKRILTTGFIAGPSSFSGKTWVDGNLRNNFSNVPYSDTSLFPIPMSTSLVIGARSPSNDNWMKCRFYGGSFIAKELNERERNIIESHLHVNCYG